MPGTKARIFIPGVGESEVELGGGTPYAQDTTQKYPLGTTIRLNGRTFIYAKASGTQNPDVGSHIAAGQHMAYATVAASAAAGVTSITADFGATDGAAGDGVLAEDELVGGYLLVFPHSSNTFIRQIIGNTAVASGGGEVTIELDSPTPVAVVVDVSHCEAMASPYLNVISGNYPKAAIVGIPTYPATTGKYFWLQTWGPCWVSPQAEVGEADHDIQVVFRHDGSIDEHDYSDAYVTKEQHAGFVLTHAAAGTQGAPFIMLQITP
jgi:hypothetical protein